MTRSESTDDRHPVEVLAEEFASRLRAGETPTIEEYASRYPEHSEVLRAVLPSIALIERVSSNDDQARKRSESHPRLPNASGVPTSLGDFDILREVGRGGMGVVYEAVQRSLNRPVALKVINGSISGNSKHGTRFRREAEAAASLHHTNIVPIYGIGEDHGLQYYAMQLIDGVTLHDVIDCLRNNAIDSTVIGEAAHRMLSRPNTETAAPFSVEIPSATHPLPNANVPNANMPNANLPDAKACEDGCKPLTVMEPTPESTMRIDPHSLERLENTGRASDQTGNSKLTREYYRNVARTIANTANALSYAHHQRVLHRDIKPANLLLDREGTVWITDFGLARRTDLDAETQTGEILGTLRYMAPEQIAGTGDARVDIYSLGLTLFELLTLKPAIESPKLRLLDPERNSVVRNPRSIQPNIPPDLATITLKACAYAPGDRYQRASELEEDLRRFVDDRPILARRATLAETLVRWGRRNPTIAVLASATLLLLVLIAGLLGIWNRQQQRAIREIGAQFERAENNLKAKAAALSQVEQEQARAEKNLELAMKAFDQITANIASRGSAISLGSELADEEIGEFADATLSQADVALLESLLEFFDQFSEENAKDLRIESAVGRQRVADIQNKLGQLDKAAISYQKAMDAFRSILEQRPDQIEVVLPMMAIYTERLMLFAKRGQIPKSLNELDEARSLLRQSPAVSQSAEGRFALARLLNGIGTIALQMGEEARLRTTRLGTGRPFPPPDVFMADQAARLKRVVDANAEALTLLKQLVSESPDNVPYQVVMGRALRDESRIARVMKDAPRADEALRRSIELFESLIRSHPDSAAFKYELADTLSKNVGQRPLDLQRCTEALRISEEISRENPHVPEYRALKASILAKLSVGATPKRGEELLIEAVAIRRDLVDRYSDIAAYSHALILSLRKLADLQRTLGLTDKAKENEELANKELAKLRKQFKAPKLMGGRFSL